MVDPSHSQSFNRDLEVKAREDRPYRSLISDDRLCTFRVRVKETDLLVRTQRPLEKESRDLVLKHRMPLERYIGDYPEFVHQLTPLPPDPMAPPIVNAMLEASCKAGVGPMAAVAGALAECVGRDLLKLSQEVIVENGGDIFIMSPFPLTVAIYAGRSPLSNKLGVRIDPAGDPIAVCTSSGTVGHSLSLGRADAALVVSRSAALADASATAVGNHASDRDDIPAAIRLGEQIQGVSGVVVIVGGQVGAWGDLTLERLKQ